MYVSSVTFTTSVNIVNNILSFVISTRLLHYGSVYVH